MNNITIDEVLFADLLEEVNTAAKDIDINESDINYCIFTDDEILTFLEDYPLDQELPMVILEEVVANYSFYNSILNEDIIDENIITNTISKIGHGIMAAGGKVTSVIARPWSALVTSIGLTAARALVRKMKSAGEKRDQEKMNTLVTNTQNDVSSYDDDE